MRQPGIPYKKSPYKSQVPRLIADYAWTKPGTGAGTWSVEVLERRVSNRAFDKIGQIFSTAAGEIVSCYVKCNSEQAVAVEQLGALANVGREADGRRDAEQKQFYACYTQAADEVVLTRFTDLTAKVKETAENKIKGDEKKRAAFDAMSIVLDGAIGRIATQRAETLGSMRRRIAAYQEKATA